MSVESDGYDPQSSEASACGSPRHGGGGGHEATCKASGGSEALAERVVLKVGFIPITCATPIIMAHPMGFYAKHGLDVDVVKTAGWAVIRDKTLNKEYDAAHMLSPMPLAITLGAGRAPCPTPCRRSRTSTARRSRCR
jgi:ABC-type nitrate/sulfonate/bicarbonate transport system substrate-binding protein